MPDATYRFGAYTLDIARASLCRGAASVALRPKSFALLHYLVAHAGRLVGKDELLAAVWPGVVVTEDSLTRCISEIRSALDDQTQQTIKTLPRRGYRFDGPVNADDNAPGIEPLPLPSAADTPADTPAVTPSASTRRWGQQARRAGVGLLAAATLIAYALRGDVGPGAASASAAALSLVVEPFAAQGSDAAPLGLAQTLTADLSAALARLHGVTVFVRADAALAAAPASRNAGLWQRNAPIPAARYSVEGSIQRLGALLRIRARLIDANTRASLWSDQFDIHTDAAAPAAQDTIVLRLASALDAELVRAGAEAAGRETAFGSGADADALALQCVAVSRAAGAATAEAGPRLCEQALQQNPAQPRALARLAWYHADRVSRGQTLDAAADLALADGYAERALGADSGYDAAHCARAIVREGQHRVPEAVVSAQRCLALNPANAGALRLLAIQHFFLHQPQQTLAYVERGLALGPRDPQLAGLLLFKGWALLQLQREPEALDWLRQAEAASPHSPNIVLTQAVALVFDGQIEPARRAMAAYLALPRTRARTLSQWDHRPDPNAAFAAFAARVNAALLAAGLPP